MHHQKSEYPLDYTKTQIPQAKASTGDLSDRLDGARDKTDEAATKVAEQVSELTEEAKNAFDRLLPSVEKSLKERPDGSIRARGGLEEIGQPARQRLADGYIHGPARQALQG